MNFFCLNNNTQPYTKNNHIPPVILNFLDARVSHQVEHMKVFHRFEHVYNIGVTQPVVGEVKDREMLTLHEMGNVLNRVQVVVRHLERVQLREFPCNL